MPNLETNIKYLKGVGEKKASVLEKELGIIKIEDLLYHFPYRYVDRTKFYKISEINPHLPYIQIKGIIRNFSLQGQRNKQRLTARLHDDTGSIELVWFKGLKWIQQSHTAGKEYVVFGKPTLFNRKINIVHPEVESLEKYHKNIPSAFEAVYPTTEKMKKSYLNAKAIHKIQQSALKLIDKEIPETLPAYLLKKYKLISRNQALRNIHFPESNELLRKAQYRIKFEELFYLQLKILKQKVNRTRKFKGYILKKVDYFFNTFYKKNLPFSLTGAQKRVIKEIHEDMSSGKQMNRLLQGDVGSGKTLVALMALLIAVDNGFQGCIMAPTEILATQHYQTVCDFLKGLDINIQLLTGSTKKSTRDTIHKQLIDGQLQILIGTHALIEDVVQFKNLGLVVIDEQHRFGVAQRAKLWTKNQQPPHVLVMTATPIPRTLSMTVYGDLDVSVIDELPPGRKPVKTYHVFDGKRLRVFKFMREQIAKGRQIYVVYPLIKESEKMDYKDLEDGYESISRAFPPPQYSVSIVHGQMRPVEKEKAMNLFVKGQTNIMVATTVIEVGVNVPNATVMIIESTERFGLSQLHQLRGRVGRGADQSFCILMTGHKLSKVGKKRIHTMTETNDGFKIAEVDMKLRGPGDMEGTQQSGFAFDLKMASLTDDSELLSLVRNIATNILDDDNQLKKTENQLLVQQLDKISKSKTNWRVIS